VVMKGGFKMPEPKFTLGLREKLMSSVASKPRPATQATDPLKSKVQRALNQENTLPRDARPPEDDVQ
jgi:hypothetical protein